MISRRKDLEVDLGYLRDNLVQAVAQGNSGVVKDGLATYEELVVSFMEEVARFTDTSDPGQAVNAASWEELRWVSDAYFEMTDAALQGTRRTILNEIMEFPLGVAYRAFDANDLHVFAEALHWTRLCYMQSTDQLTNDTARVSHADIARYVSLRLHELLAYSIVPGLENSLDASDVNRSVAFAESAFVTYGAFLKQAYDRSYFDDFTVFSRDLYDVFGPGFPRYEFAYWRYDDTPLSLPQEALVELHRFLEVMSIGLDAWILRDVMAQKLDGREARQYRGSLVLPSDPKALWNLYLRTNNREYDRKFGWGWWEAEERQPRRAYVGMDFSWLVLRDVLLRMMEVTAPLDATTVEEISLEVPENLDYVLNDSGPVAQQLAALEESQPVQALVDFDLPEAAEKLRSLFHRLRVEAEEQRQARIKEAPLSDARVAVVRSEVAKGWKESSYLRAVVRELGHYRYHSRDSGESTPLAIHRLDRKEMYIEPSRFSIDRAGTEYGRSMAAGEDRYIADALVTQLTRFDANPIESSSVVKFVSDALETIGAQDAVILVVGTDPGLWSIRQTKDFEWGPGIQRQELPRPDGFFRSHAVYQVHEPDKAFVVVVDLQRAGVWHQYRPDVPEGGQLLEKKLLFELSAYTVESAEELLAQAPDTYAFDDQLQRRRTHAEQLDLVLQSVRLRILEKLRYEVDDPDAGRVAEVKLEIPRP